MTAWVLLGGAIWVWCWVAIGSRASFSAFKDLRAPARYAVDRLKIAEILASRWPRLRHAVAICDESGDSDSAFRKWVETEWNVLFGIGVVNFAVCAIGGLEEGWTWAALGIMIFTFMARSIRVIKKMKNIQEQILCEFPDFLNRFVLLLNAGESIHQAFERAAQSVAHNRPGPLSKLLLRALLSWSNGGTFPDALERLRRDCGLPDVGVFASTVLLYYRKGGSDLAAVLREMCETLWEKRKAHILAAGERASSKMVFPMALIFLVVSAIVAAPAVMSLNR